MKIFIKYIMPTSILSFSMIKSAFYMYNKGESFAVLDYFLNFITNGSLEDLNINNKRESLGSDLSTVAIETSENNSDNSWNYSRILKYTLVVTGGLAIVYFTFFSGGTSNSAVLPVDSYESLSMILKEAIQSVVLTSCNIDIETDGLYKKLLRELIILKKLILVVDERLNVNITETPNNTLLRSNTSMNSLNSLGEE